jgi:hypothetical protein
MESGAQLRTVGGWRLLHLCQDTVDGYELQLDDFIVLDIFSIV